MGFFLDSFLSPISYNFFLYDKSTKFLFWDCKNFKGKRREYSASAKGRFYRNSRRVDRKEQREKRAQDWRLETPTIGKRKVTSTTYELWHRKQSTGRTRNFSRYCSRATRWTKNSKIRGKEKNRNWNLSGWNWPVQSFPKKNCRSKAYRNHSNWWRLWCYLLKKNKDIE